MATGFRRIAKAIEAHQAALSSLDGADAAADHATVQAIEQDVQAVLQPAVERFVKRAQEKDEESRIYGPKMVAKVRPARALACHIRVRILPTVRQRGTRG